MRFITPVKKVLAAFGCSLALGLISCGGGGGSTPAPIPDPVISQFSAAKPMITKGTNSTVTGLFSNGTGTVNNGVGAVVSGTPVTVSPSVDTTYTLVVTNSAGKSATSTCSIAVVDPPAQPAVVLPDLVIANQEGCTAYVSAQPGCSYAWTITGGTITAGAASPSITFTAGASGSIQVACVVTNPAGTSSPAGTATCVIVTVPMTPTVAAPAYVTASQGGYSASVPSQAGCTYAWTIEGGTIPGDATARSVTFSAGASGTVSLSCTISNQAGNATGTAACSVVPAPAMPTLTAPDKVTANQVGYTASVEPQFGCTYAWTISGGAITAGAASSNVTFTAGPTGTTRLSCVVINQAGTSSSAGTFACSIVTPPEVPVVTAPAFVSADQGGYAASVPAQPGCTYEWSITGGTITAGAATSTITFTASSAGVTRLSCIATNQAGTTSPVGTTSCTIVPLPSISRFSGSAPIITLGHGAILSFDFAGGDGEIDHGVGLVASGGSINVPPVADTTYTLTVTNPAGSSIQQSVAIRVVPAPTITSFLPSSRWLVNCAQTSTLTGVFSHGWGVVDQGVGAVVSGVATPSTGVLIVPTTYTLTVTNLAGDSISASTTIYPPSPLVAGVSSSFSLLLKADGTVWAWGSNLNGQLGDGTSVSRSVPLPVNGLNGAVAVSGGADHSLALKADGTVWAWGWNNEGQLGIGMWGDRFVPTGVPGLTSVVAVAGGGYHSLALKSDGTVWTWGSNGYGQLGDGTTTSRMLPVPVLGLTDVVAVAGGAFHSLALKSDGTVWAWGLNDYGQLGDGTTTNGLTPVQVTGLQGIATLAGGFRQSLAVKSDGTLWVWGFNGNGNLGDGSYVSRSTPVQVTSLTAVVAVAGGGDHSLALTSDGTTWAWGNNWSGQLGAGNEFTPTSAPIPVSGQTGVVAIAVGGTHSLTLKADRTVWAWGSDASGQMGTGATIEALTPQRVSLGPVTKVAAGGYHVTALGADGTGWSWGYAGLGALGYATQRDSSTPGQMGLPTGIIALANGEIHSLALRSDGTVWTWGSNSYGELGDDTTPARYVPLPVAGLSQAVAIAGGYYTSLALKSDGTVWAWGFNLSGELGDGTTINRSLPVQVNGLTDVIAIAGGAYRNLALKSDGTVWSWGNNSDGGLGDGTTTNRLVPVQVSGLTNVVAISMGHDHGLALKSDGTVWAWGLNWHGQLGNGTTLNQVTPVPVSGLTGVTAVAGGLWHSLALKSDGTVWAWGYNHTGQLGDGTTTDRLTPVQVLGLTDVTGLAAGREANLALRGDQSVWVWGSGVNGQLGDNRPLYSIQPRKVMGMPVP